MSENSNMSERGVPPRMPNWVKVFIVLLIALALIVVIAHLMGFRFDHGAGGALVGSIASLFRLT